MSILKKIQHLTNKDGTYFGSRWITVNHYGGKDHVKDYGNDRIFSIYKCRRADRVCLIESYEKHLDVVRYTKNADDLKKIKVIEISVEYATTGTIENKTKKFVNPNNISTFSVHGNGNGFRFNLPEPHYVREQSHRKATVYNMTVYNVSNVHYSPRMNRPAAYRGNFDISQKSFDSNSVYCRLDFDKIRTKILNAIEKINKNDVDTNADERLEHKNGVGDLAEILAKYSVINYYICSSWDSFDEHWDMRTISYETCWELARKLMLQIDVFSGNLTEINVPYSYLYYRVCRRIKDILGYDLNTFAAWMKDNVNHWVEYKHERNCFPENFDENLKRDFINRFPTKKRLERNNRNQEIIDMYLNGMKQIDIASETGMSYPQVRRIIKEYRDSLSTDTNTKHPEYSPKMITFSNEKSGTESSSEPAVMMETVEPEYSPEMILFSNEEIKKPVSKPGLSLKVNLGSKLDSLSLDLTSNSFNVSEVPNETKTTIKQVKSADGTKGLW